MSSKPHKNKNIEYTIRRDHYSAIRRGSNYYYFNPIELNTGLLQYLLDTNKLTCTPDGLTIQNFPSMLCEQTPENRKNENAYMTVIETPGFDRLSHERDFFMKEIFTMNARNKDTGEPVTIRQNVSYVRRMGQLLKEGRHECELGIGSKFLIHETINWQGNPCHIVGVPQYTSLMYKHPNYMKSIASTQYNFEKDYLDLYTTLTGNPVNSMADVLLATGDFKKLNGHTIDAIEQLDTDPQQKETLKTKVAQQLNATLKDTFDRPDVTVSYTFYVFNMDYRPLIYSLHELTPEHRPILERIKELIETVIPRTHHLLRPGETRFENFFSFCKYGDLFCVRSEYIHPAHRPLYYVHEYQRSMMLDEIIYTLNIPTEANFWNRVTFTYYIHKYRTVGSKILLHPNTTPQINRVLSKRSTKHRSHTLNNKTKRHPSSKNIVVHNPPTHCILPGDKIVNCYLYHNHKTIIVLRRVNTFYLVILKPVLTHIDLTKEHVSYREYYKCGNTHIYGIITDRPLFEVSEYKEIGPCRSKKDIREECGGLFIMSFWGFPLIKQSLPDYEFLDTLYNQYVKHSFSSSYSYVLLNKFNSFQDDSISKAADICKYKSCTIEELKADHMHYYRKYIYQGGQPNEYTIIVDKYEHVINNVPYYKYVCWVYKTIHGELTTNETRNIMFIPGKDLLGIINFLKTRGADLYEDPTGPHPDMMLINFNTTELVDMLHIQIFPKTDNVNRYYPSLYSTNFNLSTETRGHPISNIISKLEVYPNYYNELKGVQCIFNVGTLSSLYRRV